MVGGSGWWRQVCACAAVLLVLALTACSSSSARPPDAARTPARKPVAHPVSWTWQPDAPRWFVPQGVARAGDRLFSSFVDFRELGEGRCFRA